MRIGLLARTILDKKWPSRKDDAGESSFLKYLDQIILPRRPIQRSSRKADFYGTASEVLVEQRQQQRL